MAPFCGVGLRERSIAIIPYVPAFAGSKPGGLTLGFQPTTVPSSVAKRNTAGAEIRAPVLDTPEILKACWLAAALLKTTPVGVPPEPSGSPGVGIETTNDRGAPFDWCNVETPAPLSDTQNGDVAELASTHGLTRCGS